MYKKTIKNKKFKFYKGGNAMNPKLQIAKALIKNKGSTEQTINDLLKVIKDGGVDVAIDIAKAGVAIANDFVSNSIDYALGVDVNKETLPDLIKTSKEKLIKLSQVAEALLKDPETQAAIKQLAEAVLQMVNDTFTAIQPYLDQLAQQVSTTVEEVGSTAAAGMTKTGISVAQAAVAEIPVVGGIIDLGVAAGKGFNATAKTIERGLNNMDKITELMNDATSKAIPPVVKGVKEIQTAKEKLSNASSRVQSSIQQAQQTEAMKGGFKKNYYLKYKTRKNRI